MCHKAHNNMRRGELLQVYAFWERLASMAQSVCVQLAERLLRKERVSQFATRFRPDGLSWSVVLLSASSHFVNGWCATACTARFTCDFV